jgi:hypothetical protein
VKRITKTPIKFSKRRKSPQTFLNFTGDPSSYNTMNNNTPADSKFSIGSFNYNPVTQTSFSFFPNKTLSQGKNKKMKNSSFLHQKSKGKF